MGIGPGSRWRLFADPWFIVAVALLALNDHVLKAASPGLVTGKVSDFTGLFVATALLGVASRSRWIPVVTAALGFVALKTVPSRVPEASTTRS
ncbi:MAG: hypothetical protein ABJC79_04800 [Acidimicrobiia bacterium]